MDKLVQDQFLQPVKDHPCDIFGYVGKIMPCFFSNMQKLNLVVKIRKHAFERIKICWSARSQIFDH